jgi:hypothetical protein
MFPYFLFLPLSALTILSEMTLNKQILFTVSMLLLALSSLTACSSSDDVVAIFTGKKWKLSFIAAEGSTQRFDFWQGDTEAEKNSMKLLGVANNFTLQFNGADMGTYIGGGFSAQGVNSKPGGTWNADGKSRTLTMQTTSNGSESDVFAKAFLTGLLNAFRYEGDTNNLFIYYHDGKSVKYMGFFVPR